MVQNLSNDQINGMREFIYAYRALNRKISELEETIISLQKESERVMEELDTLRESEGMWVKKNAAIANLSETEFINLCMRMINNVDE